MKLKKIGIICISFLMIMANCHTTISIHAKGQEEETPYEIYPKPRKVTYSGGDFVIHQNIAVIYDSKIDAPTKKRVKEIFDEKEIILNEANTLQPGTTNIVIGTYDSNEYASNLLNEQLTPDADFFDKIDSHILSIQNNVIGILGKDTDAAFYGVTSLKHIMHQIEGKSVRNVRIDDYASTVNRGFIEGYYGTPWSNEGRMSLMKFGGDFKMTSYAFAPKNDPYHSGAWRELYPESMIPALKEMVQVGLDSKCRFVWTIHPLGGSNFMGENYEKDYKDLITKFEQLYSLGVRQFGILADDAGGIDKTMLIKLLNDISKWANDKGDVYDILFCPAGYNEGWQGDYSELNALRDAPKNIKIFWTGSGVCGWVTQDTIDAFKTRNLPAGKEPRRDPLFWLNWPVNDINGSRLMMGKGEVLIPGTHNLNGILSNPMQEVEANKPALFAVADYSWNSDEFDDDKSWADSFKYIEPDAPEAFHTLAKHISDPSPNGHGLTLGESEDLKPKLEAFQNKLENNESIIKDGNDLIKEFDTIDQACIDFQKLSKNEELKKNVNPWRTSLSSLSKAIIAFIKTEIAIEENDSAAIWSNFSEGSAKFETSKKCPRYEGVGGNYVQAGAKRLIPFAKFLQDNLTPLVSETINPTENTTKVITNRPDTPSGKLENLIDGSLDTEAIWANPSTINLGEYIGLRYSTTTSINKITFYMGQKTNLNDTFNDAKFQYTNDGKTWIDIPNATFTNTASELTIEGLSLKAKGIRAIATSNREGTWLGCREILINDQQLKDKDKTITGNAFYNDTLMSARSGDIINLNDGNLNSGISFAENPYNEANITLVGSYVGVMFQAPTEIGDVIISQSENDKISKGSLEYTIDGNEWITIENKEDIGAEYKRNCTGLSVKGIRLRNLEQTQRWWQVNEISVGEPKAEIDTSLPLNKKIFKTNEFSIYEGTDDHLLDNNDDTSVLYKTNDNISRVNDYVGVDLGRLAELGNIHLVVGANTTDHWTNYDLEYSKDGKEYVKYASYKQSENKKIIDEDLTSKNIRARYIRLRNTKEVKNWIHFSEFSVSENNFNSKAYTNVDDYKKVKVLNTLSMSKLPEIEEVSLKPQEYIGIKLERLKDIKEIVNTIDGEGASSVTLQISKNEIEWKDIKDKNDFESARYIRLLNKTQNDLKFNIKGLTVLSNEIEPVSIKDTNYGTIDNPLNAFDHDRTTETSLSENQDAGKYVTYDLGQSITLNKFKYVIHDSQWDYIRHAKISVSTDNINWQEIMLIGENEKDDTVTIEHFLPDHEISYNTKTVDNLNLKNIRYIKHEITQTINGPSKWVRINEFEINDNEFMPSANDPTVISTLPQTAGYENANLIDGNSSTIYQPASKEKGSIVYQVSDNASINKILVLQSPNTITGAKVEARVITKDKDTKWIMLGNLNLSMNEFVLPETIMNVLEVKISWEANRAPALHELILYKEKDVQEANKEKLNQLLNMVVDTQRWTQRSSNLFNNLKKDAQEIYDNEFAAQTSIDSIEKELRNAITQKQIKGDPEIVEKILNQVNKLDEKDYTKISWETLANVVLDANKALSDKENLAEEDVAFICKELNDAMGTLTYTVIDKENVYLLFTSLDSFMETIQAQEEQYVVNSLNALTKALEEAKSLKDATPKAYRVMFDKLTAAKSGLLDATNLHAILDEFKKLEPGAYTNESYKPYKEEIESSKHLLIDATSIEEITKAVNTLKDLRAKLVITVDKSALKEAINGYKKLNKTNYTTTTFEALQLSVTNAEKLVENEDLSVEQIQIITKEMESAFNSLVNVEALSNEIDNANKLEKDKYSSVSWMYLSETVTKAKDLLKNGTNETITIAIKNIQNAKDELVLLCNKKELNTYVNNIEKVSQKDYTKDSFEEYMNELNSLQRLCIQKEVSVMEATLAKSNVEAARKGLVSIKEINDYLKDLSVLSEKQYTRESFENYKQALTKLKSLENKGTRNQIDEALNNLKAAVKALQELPKTKELEKLIANIEKMNLSSYTKDSIGNLQASVLNAKAMLLSREYDKAQVSEMFAKVKQAKENLVLSKDMPLIDGVNTSDITLTQIYIGGMLIGVFVLLLVRKRKALK
ncbi:MAG: beta-N-acetylglucosaminidase domain-containing protein [Bacilli bacterium]